MPIEAKERDVRSQARNVRSINHVSIAIFRGFHSQVETRR
jgi:hypothetical protein